MDRMHARVRLIANTYSDSDKVMEQRDFNIDAVKDKHFIEGREALDRTGNVLKSLLGTPKSVFVGDRKKAKQKRKKPASPKD